MPQGWIQSSDIAAPTGELGYPANQTVSNQGRALEDDQTRAQEMLSQATILYSPGRPEYDPQTAESMGVLDGWLSLGIDEFEDLSDPGCSADEEEGGVNSDRMGYGATVYRGPEREDGELPCVAGMVQLHTASAGEWQSRYFGVEDLYDGDSEYTAEDWRDVVHLSDEDWSEEEQTEEYAVPHVPRMGPDVDMWDFTNQGPPSGSSLKRRNEWGADVPMAVPACYVPGDEFDGVSEGGVWQDDIGVLGSCRPRL